MSILLRPCTEEFAESFFASPLSSPNSEALPTPRLEVGEIDSAPFSHTFAELFDGLGLYVPEKDMQDSPDVSYYLENITNIKDIVPDWQHDEIDEIVVMSAKRPATLPTIQEDKREGFSIPTAKLSDFSFDVLDSNHVPTLHQPCVYRETGTFYSIKKARATLGPALREKMILEAVTELQVPFVSHVRWVFQEGDQVYSVIDHYPTGNLFDYVQQHGTLDSLRAVFYSSELVVAISALHRIGVVHQGLDPKNVMLDSNGHIVLADFSHADFSHSTESKQTGMSKNQISNIMPEYRAPEILLGWPRDAAVDCWSFGMLVYFMLFGTHPYGANKGEPNGWIYDRIVRSSIPLESLRLISPTARDLILKCLERNPAVRWTVDKIKGHPYFSFVDWHMVFSKRVEAPSVPAVGPFSPLPTKEAQRKRLSLQGTMSPIPDHRRSLSSVNLGRRRSIASVASVHNDVPIALEPSKPILKIAIPSIVTEEEEVISETETNGHAVEQPRSGNQAERLNQAERMAHFWDNLDKEERSSQTSAPSKEFGELDVPGKAPKLRKHRSSIHPRHLRFNFSTSSFQMKLRRKPRSTGALRDPTFKEPEKVANLPIGIHQVGSGIGFTYNMPAQVPSKVSVHSFAPSCGHNIFQGRFSVKKIGRGLGDVTRKTKIKPASEPEAVLPPITLIDHVLPRDETDELTNTRETGNGTFIRDMCRTPSWILSPPDSLPSPMALVNGNYDLASPQTDSGPLTPATLVNVVAGEVNEVNINIPKDLEITCDLSDDALALAPDSTLRLVPPSALRLSFVEDITLLSRVSAA